MKVTGPLARILGLIVNLRQARGDERWPDGTCQRIYGVHARNARVEAGSATFNNGLTWSHILKEAVFSALESEDPAATRECLLTVATIAVGWIERIDRREEEHRGDRNPSE